MEPQKGSSSVSDESTTNKDAILLNTVKEGDHVIFQFEHGDNSFAFCIAKKGQKVAGGTSKAARIQTPTFQRAGNRRLGC